MENIEEKQYTPINWVDEQTPLSAENLNYIEERLQVALENTNILAAGLDTNGQSIDTLNEEKANLSGAEFTGDISVPNITTVSDITCTGLIQTLNLEVLDNADIKNTLIAGVLTTTDATINTLTITGGAYVPNYDNNAESTAIVNKSKLDSAVSILQVDINSKSDLATSALIQADSLIREWADNTFLDLTEVAAIVDPQVSDLQGQITANSEVVSDLIENEIPSVLAEKVDKFGGDTIYGTYAIRPYTNGQETLESLLEVATLTATDINVATITSTVLTAENKIQVGMPNTDYSTAADVGLVVYPDATFGHNLTVSEITRSHIISAAKAEATEIISGVANITDLTVLASTTLNIVSLSSLNVGSQINAGNAQEVLVPNLDLTSEDQQSIDKHAANKSYVDKLVGTCTANITGVSIAFEDYKTDVNNRAYARTDTTNTFIQDCIFPKITATTVQTPLLKVVTDNNTTDYTITVAPNQITLTSNTNQVNTQATIKPDKITINEVSANSISSNSGMIKTLTTNTVNVNGKLYIEKLYIIENSGIDVSMHQALSYEDHSYLMVGTYTAPTILNREPFTEETWVAQGLDDNAYPLQIANIGYVDQTVSDITTPMQASISTLATDVTALQQQVQVWYATASDPTITINPNNDSLTSSIAAKQNDILYYRKIYGTDLNNTNATVVEHSTFVRNNNTWEEIQIVDSTNKVIDLVESLQAVFASGNSMYEAKSTEQQITLVVTISDNGKETVGNKQAALQFASVNGANIIKITNSTITTDQLNGTIKATLRFNDTVTTRGTKSYTIRTCFGSRYEENVVNVKFGNKVYWYTAIGANVYDHTVDAAYVEKLAYTNEQTQTINISSDKYIYYKTPWQITAPDDKFKVGPFTGGFTEIATPSTTNNTTGCYIYRTDLPQAETITIEILS